MAIGNYCKLKAWEAAMDLVEEVYNLTATFPQHELFGLSSQIRRAAMSVPSNVAEGRAKDSSRAYLRHIYSDGLVGRVGNTVRDLAAFAVFASGNSRSGLWKDRCDREDVERRTEEFEKQEYMIPIPYTLSPDHAQTH